MSMQGFVEAIVAFVREHETWAIPIAFLVAFGESFCFFSIVWPGTAILVGIAALIAASGIKETILVPLIISAALGGIFGYALSYWIGRYFQDSMGRIWPFSSHPHMIPYGQAFFNKYGLWSVFLGHFFGPVRAIIPVVAGMFRMPQLPFQLANAASSAIWAAGVIAPSFFFVTFKDEILAFIKAHGIIVALLLMLLAFLNSVPTHLYAFTSLILFVGLGALYLYANGSFQLALGAGAIGAFAGDLMAYRGGVRHARDFHTLWPSGWNRDAADQARRLVGQWGIWALPVSKFHTTLRGFAPMAAGAAGMNLAAFAVASALSAAIWATVLLLPRPILAYVFGW